MRLVLLKIARHEERLSDVVYVAGDFEEGVKVKLVWSKRALASVGVRKIKASLES